MAIIHSSGSKKTTFAGVAIAILIGLYGLLRPSINEATGWSLPAIAQTQSDNATTPAKPSPDNPSPDNPSREKPAERATDVRSPAQTPPSTAESAQRQPSGAEPDATKDRGRQSDAAPRPNAPVSRPAADETQPNDTLKYGSLREIGKDRYISLAGLLYTPGSAEGHRLEHLRRHTEDQPSRPGKHGVFDGGMEGALKTIDQAYENAKIGKRTSTRKEDGRTIYTVDLGQRIGFVGGQDGNQKNQPMARRVQLVLDGNRVITAFPL